MFGFKRDVKKELNDIWKDLNAFKEDALKHLCKVDVHELSTDGKLDQATVRNAKNYKLIQLGEYDTECGITGYGSDYKVIAEFKDLIPTENENSPKTE